MYGLDDDVVSLLPHPPIAVVDQREVPQRAGSLAMLLRGSPKSHGLRNLRMRTANMVYKPFFDYSKKHFHVH